MMDLLTTQQLAAYLQIDPMTVYRLVREEKLPGFKVGGQWRFSRPEIEHWLREQPRAWTPPSVPIISVIGRSGVGKTTLLEKLIGELKRRGYRVATVKHHAHVGFEVDVPGKDTWRHAQAGSEQVALSAPDRVALIRYVDQAMPLDEITRSLIHGVDVILTDGFSQADQPQIEVVRAATGQELIGDPEKRLAVASDVPLALEAPRFDLNDVPGLVDLIEARFLSRGEEPHT
jgi:molybdopterin-guanine dinucleotide biosynthesis protein B